MKSAGEIPSEYYVSDDEENSNSAGGDEGNIENEKEAEETSSESSGYESDDVSSSDESIIMPYTVDDIQLPPHPKRIKWSDEALSSTGTGTSSGIDEGTEALSLLVSTRLIPGGRLGRHFWTLDDVPEGSSFRFSNVSNKDRRRMRKERMNSAAQKRKKDKKKKKEKANSASKAAPQCQCDGVSLDMSPETTKITCTPDDCVSDHEDLDDVIIGETGNDGNGDDDAESATSEGSGWGASRRLSDVGGDLEDEDEDGHDDDDDEEETDDNLAAGQRIEHSIQNMDTVQREKLVEAMMNDILKSMRAIEKRKREESEEQQEKNDEEGSTTPKSIDTEKSVDQDDAPIDIDPIEGDDKITPGNEVKAGIEEEHSGSNGDESDFFVDMLTDENVDDFVQAQAVEWMDDAQKDDDDDDEEDDEFDKFLENYSSSRLSDGEEDSGTNATGSLLPSRTSEDDELVFKHRFMLDGGDDVDVDEETTGLKRSAVERRRKGSAPTVSSISHRSQRPARPTLPPRQISSKKNLRDTSKSTLKKKKKKSFAKRMFKISLQGEIDETKRKMAMRRHGSDTNGLRDHDSVGTDGSRGSFRSSATGRDSVSRLGGSSGREQSMVHDRQPVPSGRYTQMRKSNGSSSTVSSGGSGGSVDAGRQHRQIPGGRSSVAKGQGRRPPGSSRDSTSSGRGRGPMPRPRGGAAPGEVTSSIKGIGRGSGARGTVMRAPGRGARGAPQRTNARASVRASAGRQSKNIRPPTEGQRGHNLRTSSLSPSGTGGKATTAAPKGGNQQQQRDTTEGEKKKKKKLFKLNLKAELVDQQS